MISCCCSPLQGRSEDAPNGTTRTKQHQTAELQQVWEPNTILYGYTAELKENSCQHQQYLWGDHAKYFSLNTYYPTFRLLLFAVAVFLIWHLVHCQINESVLGLCMQVGLHSHAGFPCPALVPSPTASLIPQRAQPHVADLPGWAASFWPVRAARGISTRKPWFGSPPAPISTAYNFRGFSSPQQFANTAFQGDVGP